MKPKAILKAAKVFVIAHGAEIATGVGVALTFAAGVKAVKETPKVIRIVEEKREAFTEGRIRCIIKLEALRKQWPALTGRESRSSRTSSSLDTVATPGYARRILRFAVVATLLRLINEPQHRARVKGKGGLLQRAEFGVS